MALRFLAAHTALLSSPCAVGAADSPCTDGTCAPHRRTATLATESLLLQTRLDVSAVVQEECHTAVKGEECYKAVAWAKRWGVKIYKDWYPGLNSSSSFEAFQEELHKGGYGQGHHGSAGYAGCGRPCGRSVHGHIVHGEVATTSGAPIRPSPAQTQVPWTKHSARNCNPPMPGKPDLLGASLEECWALCEKSSGCWAVATPAERQHLSCYLRREPCPVSCTEDAKWITYTPPTGKGEDRACHAEGLESSEQPKGVLWRASSTVVGEGACQMEAPRVDWSLNGHCGGASLRVKVLTYNLFWWNLFGARGGDGGSAGKLIAESSRSEPYDIMGFQECRDVWRVLRDAGLDSSFTGLQLNDGDIALGLAYRKAAWLEVERGEEHVAVDRPEQFYGERGVQWVRLRHTASDRVVFFLNHHGPLPVNTGGKCGGRVTAYKLLRAIGQHAQVGDLIFLVGDLNAEGYSATQKTLQGYVHRVNGNWVDAIFSSCAGSAVKSARVLGTGGSDHPAVEAVLEL